jgi:hypothetical protein
MRSPAVSPDKSRVAIVADSSGTNPYGPGEQLWTGLERRRGAGAAEPGSATATTTPAAASSSRPAFSPDGRSLTWEEGDGIYTAGGQDKCGAGDAGS